MKFRYFLYAGALTFLTIFSALGQAPELKRIDGAADTSEYSKLVAQIRSGDKTVDLVKLRSAYMDWMNDECNVTTAPKRDEMVKAFEAKDYKRFVELSEAVLAFEYVNRSLHNALAIAYAELGNTEKATYHQDLSKALVKAILDSGDGKSAKTAYRVHSIREEYFVMKELGYQTSGQALVFEKDLGSFDVLTGKNSKGETVSLYFDINPWWFGSTASKPCKAKKK